MDVCQDEVRRCVVQDVERFATVLRFADHRDRQHGGAIVEQFAQPMPRGCLVVDDQDAQR